MSRRLVKRRGYYATFDQLEARLGIQGTIIRAYVEPGDEYLHLLVDDETAAEGHRDVPVRENPLPSPFDGWTITIDDTELRIVPPGHKQVTVGDAQLAQRLLGDCSIESASDIA